MKVTETSVSQYSDDVGPDFSDEVGPDFMRDGLPDGPPDLASDLEQDHYIAEVEAGMDAAVEETMVESDDADAMAADEPGYATNVGAENEAPESDAVQVIDPDADALVAQALLEVDEGAEEAQADVEDDLADVLAAEDAESGPADPLEEFRATLYTQPGEWFVVHTYSGMENRVKTNLENRKVSLNMEEYIHDVVVPVEEVAEIKNGQRRMVKRTVLPGYVLVRMDLTDESWAAVRHTPSVTGFVGHSHQPVPLSLAEVESMLAPSVEAAAAVATAGGAEAASTKKTPKVEFTDFAPSDSVMVVDGPFATLHATITEINVDAQRVKALVEIFGRETPVELSFTQIQRV
jgi:transcriptional antiterminator NusG